MTNFFFLQGELQEEREGLRFRQERRLQDAPGGPFRKESLHDPCESNYESSLGFEKELDKEPKEEEGVPAEEGLVDHQHSSETHRSVVYESTSSSKTIKETTTTSSSSSGTFIPPTLRPVAQPPKDFAAQQEEPQPQPMTFTPPVLRPVAQPPKDFLVQQEEPLQPANPAPMTFTPPVLRPVAQPPRDFAAQQEPQPSATFAPRPVQPSPISGVRSVAPPVASKSFKGPEPPAATADSPRCGECDRLIV